MINWSTNLATAVRGVLGVSAGSPWPGYPPFPNTTWPFSGFWDWSGTATAHGYTSKVTGGFLGLPPAFIGTQASATCRASGTMTPPFGISSAFPNQYRVNTSYIFVTLNPNFKLSACIPPFPNGGNFMGFSNASRIATVVKRSSPITTGYIGIATHWHALNNVFMGSYMTDFASLIQSAKSGVVWTALKAPAQLSQVQAVFEVDMQIYKSTVQPNPNKLTFIAIGDQTFQLLRNFSCSTPFRASLFPGASIYKVSHFSQGHIHTMFSQLAALAGIPLTGAPASRIGKLTNFSSSNLQSCLWGK